MANCQGRQHHSARQMNSRLPRSSLEVALEAAIFHYSEFAAPLSSRLEVTAKENPRFSLASKTIPTFVRGKHDLDESTIRNTRTAKMGLVALEVCAGPTRRGDVAGNTEMHQRECSPCN